MAGEDELVGRGVAYCASCDGMFYKDKTVVVVGGGNTAAEDALILSRIAKKVILVHRRDTLRATKVYHQPLMQTENVEFRWNSVITELLHDEKLTGVRLKNVKTGEQELLPCDGVFVSVGRVPVTELVQGQLELDAGGYVVADETTATSIPGVYAVGDVRTKQLRQVVTAVADGASCGAPGGTIFDGRRMTPMKKYLKKWLRPILFTAGGALAGWPITALVGASTGSCAIASNPLNSMAYMGLIGFLLSFSFGSCCCGGSCRRPPE